MMTRARSAPTRGAHCPHATTSTHTQSRCATTTRSQCPCATTTTRPQGHCATTTTPTQSPCKTTITHVHSSLLPPMLTTPIHRAAALRQPCRPRTAAQWQSHPHSAPRNDDGHTARDDNDNDAGTQPASLSLSSCKGSTEPPHHDDESVSTVPPRCDDNAGTVGPRDDDDCMRPETLDHRVATTWPQNRCATTRWFQSLSSH